jgi:hypothetical protein
MKNLRYKILILILPAAVVFYCGKKKEGEAAKGHAKIAYAVYGVGVFDKINTGKAAEWLSRGEMVTVLENVNAPDPKDAEKTKVWAKIERTTGKQGYVDAANLESKAFVVIRPLDIFNINQASAKKLGSVPVGQVGFVVEEKADWAKVRFGYKIHEQWVFSKENTKWVDQKWAQIEGVSYDPMAIGQGVELEAALRKYSDADAGKKAAGKKELEGIIKEGKSQFIDVAQKALASDAAETEAKPAETKSETKPTESAAKEQDGN